MHLFAFDLMEMFELSEVFWRLMEAAGEHWPKALAWLACLAGTTFWGFFWARRRWKSRHDLGVIHVSQNVIAQRPTGSESAMEPWLVLDVWQECPLEEMIPDSIPRGIIQKAAKKTTADKPLLLFPEVDRWHVLNMVRNAIAEKFLLGAALKMTKAGKYEEVDCVFALTYERYPNMKQGKIRVMMIERTTLMGDRLDTVLRTESDSHIDRIATLKMMRDDYAKGDKARHCMYVRITVPV